MKRLFPILLILGPVTTWAQLGVSYHQSNLPFFGLNYEIKDRFRPELRLGTDAYFEEMTFELVVTYDILNKEDYEVYGGLGVRSEEDYGSVALPVGLNVYPFTGKKFGFHIELAVLAGEDDPVLRGSWGIRYRFKKEE
jgi:hypothetical protein